MTDKFDKAEIVIKKTTKLIILVIGSIVAIVAAGLLAWSQIDGDINKTEDSIENVADSVMVDTVFIEQPKEEVKPKNNKTKKEEPKKVEEPKKDVIDKTGEVIDKLKGLGIGTK